MKVEITISEDGKKLLSASCDSIAGAFECNQSEGVKLLEGTCDRDRFLHGFTFKAVILEGPAKGGAGC